jgi:hypothetical protein
MTAADDDDIGIRRAHQLTGLDQIFALYPTLDEALTAVQMNTQ